MRVDASLFEGGVVCFCAIGKAVVLQSVCECIFLCFFV